LDDLVQEVQIAASPETVWEELTKRDKPQRPQMDTVLESSLEPGAPLLYTSHDGSRVFVVGRVIEIDPPRRLSHTWRLTMRDDEPTLVAWELEPSGEGTRVRLTHTGWPEDARGLGRVDSTWRTILDELRNVVERGELSAKSRLTFGLQRRFAFALPKKTKRENAQPEPEEQLARWR